MRCVPAEGLTAQLQSVSVGNNNNGFITIPYIVPKGCYSYTKEIKAGESSLLLGEEEKEALEIAMSQK